VGDGVSDPWFAIASAAGTVLGILETTMDSVEEWEQYASR
jgi:hypothetical protein